MTAFLRNLLTASLHGSVVILAVLLLRVLLRKTPKKFICLLWLLAGIRLLLPIEIRSDLSLQPRLNIPLANASAARWAGAISLIWAVIALCFGVYSLISYLKLKNQVREAVKIRGGWECDRIETAFILGFMKPKIYIPTGLDGQSRRDILAHERTHLDKGDHWIKMIGFLALALHWFNPLVWIAYILLCKDIEMACDERVIRFMELDERKAYSTALLRCSSRSAHFAACPVAFGEVSVKRRILSILNYKKPSFWLSLLGVLAFFFVAICLLTTPPASDRPTPEQAAQKAEIERCRQDLEARLTGEELYAQMYGTDSNGSVRWNVTLLRQGADSMWKLNANTSEPTDGEMIRGGKHYAWYSGSWMETESAESRLDTWLRLLSWSADTAQFVSDTPIDSGRELVFTSTWESEDKAVHTETISAFYDQDGNLSSLQIEQPNYENTAKIHLSFDYIGNFVGEEKTVSDFFRDEEAAIADGVVTESELEGQSELNRWGVNFRVDDDRLSARGSDVYFGQSDSGRGSITTTDEYWLEKNVDGSWEKLPTIAAPKWEGQSFSLGKGSSTYGYLDWTPIYGELEAGLYRMGKLFHCYDDTDRYSKEAPFYSEFRISESVDLAAPETKAAVERCYAKLEELKSRKTLHWKSILGSDEAEIWADGEDYLRISTYNGPEVPESQWTEYERSLFPRTDTAVCYNGVGYETIREDPQVLTSKVLGLGISTLSPTRGGWDWMGSIAEELNMLFFERGNHTISFPEGVGVVSDEMVRFATDWTISDGTSDGIQCGAVLTYRFDSNGALCYLEYKSKDISGDDYVSSIEIFDESAEEIHGKITDALADLVVESFSWQEAEAKYTGGGFNIRQTGFVNTQVSPVSGPVEAARLAMKEYPQLANEFSIHVYQDKTMGMWKVTIESEVQIQSEYEFRDVYLSDSGITQLLVYEGPLSFDEPRK